MNVFHVGLLHSVSLFYKCSVYKNAGGAGEGGECSFKTHIHIGLLLWRPDPVLPAACPQNFTIVEAN